MPFFAQKKRFAVLAIVLAILFAYSPSLNSDFVNWDDDVHLTSNPFLRSCDARHLNDIFTTTVNGLYIPLTEFSFSLERCLWGLNPFVYHLDNVISHIFVTVCVFLFALELGLGLPASFFGALLFGIHPMHVESVAWVTERKDVLYASFYMLSLLSYCRYVKAGCGNKAFLALTFILGLLSVLSKPAALTLPLVLFVIDWFLKRRVSFCSLMEKCLLGLLIVPVVLVSYQSVARPFVFEFPRSALLWLWSFSFYLEKFFFPDFFVVFYRVPEPVVISNIAYGASVVITFLAAAVFMILRKDRLFVFSVLFYLSSIFCVLRWEISVDTNFVSDRFMYLASLGLCLWVGSLWERIVEKAGSTTRGRATAACLIVVFFAVLAWKSYEQCRVWRDSVSLWSHQIKYQEKAATALVYTRLAEAISREKDFKKLAEKYRYGQSSQGKSASRALSQKEMKQLNGVFALYDKALKIKPDFAEVYYNKGTLFVQLGDIKKAQISFYKALELDPGYFEAYFELGRIRQGLGQPEEAVRLFRKAVELSPGNPLLYESIIEALKEGEATG